MNADKHGLKSGVRQKIRAVLERISPAARTAASQALSERLKVQMPGARAILFFAPLPAEIDLWPLLEEILAAGKTVALPRFDSASQSYVACRVRNLKNDIVAGQFGIREPVPACAEIPLGEVDLILVPGVAFDLSGHRLGRGKGFYDRLLSKARGIKCGIAFDEQIVEEVPKDSHDVRMDFIFTPTRCVKVKNGLTDAADP